jgi:hypothetical protein
METENYRISIKWCSLVDKSCKQLSPLCENKEIISPVELVQWQLTMAWSNKKHLLFTMIEHMQIIA